jgi:biotin-(acetyl-CoA carboxylase) ligase
VRGVATDIDEAGALVVAAADGRRHLVVAGEVDEAAG